MSDRDALLRDLDALTVTRHYRRADRILAELTRLWALEDTPKVLNERVCAECRHKEEAIDASPCWDCTKADTPHVAWEPKED